MDKDRIVADLNKALDKKIAFVGDKEDEDVKRVATGIIPLDFALGGGIPRGRIIDFVGKESSGKSSLAFTIIAEFQKQDIPCAVVDAEYSYLASHARTLGVNTDDLIVIQPDCFEEGAEAIEHLANNGVGLILLDSVSAMLPRSEGEAEHGKAPMAIQARLMSQMMRKLVGTFAKNECTLICVNQLRVNMMSHNPYDQFTSTGGHALKYYSSIRLKVSKKAMLVGPAKVPLGHTVGFKVLKNKVAKPHGACDVRYFLDTGFEKEGDLIAMLIERGYLELRGAWVKATEKAPEGLFLADFKVQGREKAKDYLVENDLVEDVISLIFPQKTQ